MAIKKPLVLETGKFEVLQKGDGVNAWTFRNQQPKEFLQNKRYQVLIPMYFYPYDDNTNDLSADFFKIVKLSSKYNSLINTIVIFNPDSGPGTSQDGVYTECIQKLHVNSGFAIGYVDTNSGSKAITDVKSDIDKYYEWYPNIDGIFFDEFPYDYSSDLYNYYKEISNYVKSKNDNAYIVVNPGTTSNYQWFNDKDLFDLAIIWETDSWPSVNDVYSYEYKDIFPYRKGILLYSQSECADYELLNKLKPYISTWYITSDGDDGNPWDSLSSCIDNLYEYLYNSNEINQKPSIGDFFSNFVINGFDIPVPSSSSLITTINHGIAYINGKRIERSYVDHTFTASKDTYIDLDENGNYHFLEVDNNATAPDITPNSIRIAKVVTNASTITTIVDLSTRPNIYVDDKGNMGIGTLYPDAKVHIEGGELWCFNNGKNPRFLFGDSTSAGNYGYIQWDSTNKYLHFGTDYNDLKVNGNYVAIGNIYPSQPLIVGYGSTELFRVQSDGKVSINNPTPKSLFDINGSIGTKRIVAGSDYTTNNDFLIGVTAVPITTTLSSSDCVEGRIIIVKDESGNASSTSPITIQTENSETIDGQSSIQITSAYGSMRLYSDGSSWFTF